MKDQCITKKKNKFIYSFLEFIELFFQISSYLFLLWIADVVPITDVRVIIYACGLLISVPFLILTIAAYVITPRLRDVHGKALCHYCGCLALAFTTLAITQLASAHLSLQACVSIGKIINYQRDIVNVTQLDKNVQ